MSKKMTLPDNWLLSHPAQGGSGNGDEMFWPVLHRWSTWTERHGFFRRKQRTVTGWRYMGNFPFGSDGDAIEYAVKMEAMLGVEEAAPRNSDK